jgi:hypothetical protein
LNRRAKEGIGGGQEPKANIEHRTPNIEHRASSIEWPAFAKAAARQANEK